MQEALKNPHYKKIWEKVIMNRHPEAKSLEESLLIESEIKGCLALVMDYFGNTFLEEIFYCTDSDYVVVYKGGEPMGSDLGDFCHVSFYRKNLCNIIGIPITLEDIINLFTTQETNKGVCDVEIRMFTHGETVNLYNINITGYVETGEEPQYHYVGDFLYNITKPLHEQTPETWEKIANLI